MSFPEILKNGVRRGVSLKGRTSFRIGGKAEYWYEPEDVPELSLFLKKLRSRYPLFVIGAGSNLLVKEGMIRKIFISLRKADFLNIAEDDGEIRVGAGLRLNSVVSYLSKKDLGGYEFLAGIPGTVGGALAMNAGARNDYRDHLSGREMKDIVSYVEVLDKKGDLTRLSKKRIRFFYRDSSLTPYIIVSAGLKFYKAPKSEVKERIKNNIKERSRAQDWRYPSTGSFFKNPDYKAAGELIDKCGLKGRRVGGAEVSEKHANFIINKSGAKSADVLKLMEIIRGRVYNRFKIKLEPEVQIVS